MTHLQFVKTSIKHFQAMYFIQFYYTFYTNGICLFCTICSDNCTIWKHLSAVSTMICLILTIFKRKIDDITSNYHLTLGESIWKKYQHYSNWTEPFLLCWFFLVIGVQYVPFAVLLLYRCWLEKEDAKVAPLSLQNMFESVKFNGVWLVK